MPSHLFYIAFRDGGRDMVPVANGSGRIATFATLDAARDAAGALGVAATVTAHRLAELAAEHDLVLPEPERATGPMQERLL